jgi:hypothetical protein
VSKGTCLCPKKGHVLLSLDPLLELAKTANNYDVQTKVYEYLSTDHSCATFKALKVDLPGKILSRTLFSL